MTPTGGPAGSTRGRLPRIAGNVVTAGGLWSAVSLLLPRRGWPGWVDAGFSVVGVPTERSVFTAALLLLLGEALRRRLRAAWGFALAVEAGGALTVVLALLVAATDPAAMSFGPVEVGVTAAGGVANLLVLGLLVRARASFTARRRAGSLRAATATLLGGLGGLLVVVFALSWVIRAGAGPVTERSWWSLRSVLGFSLPLGLSAGGRSGPGWLAGLGGLLAALVLVVAVWQVLRSARRAELMSPADELSVRALLAAHGEHDSLGYFATRRDKSVIFSPDRAAAVVYRVVGSVCLASGDPIGPVEAWPAAIAAWLRSAGDHAWNPAVLSASERGARAYVDAGLQARELGDEAILDVERFGLEGRVMRPVKRAVAHVRGTGATVAVHRHADLERAELDELARCAEAWRGAEGDRGFSMALNRLGDPCDGRSVAVTVRDADRALLAVQSYVPWGRAGLSLDLMRRSPQAPNGVNEAMVAGVVDAADDLGVRRVSLNFAMFRSVFTEADKVGAGLGVRLTDRALTLANRFWQLASLYEANAKYLPRWEPRLVCFESLTALPQVGVAAGIAEGFLPGRAPAVERTGEDVVTLGDGVARRFADLVAEQDRELLRPPSPTHRPDDQERVRRTKLATLRAAGMEPYPATVPRTADLATARAAVEQRPGDAVAVSGRVRALRDLGGVVFAVLEENGTRLQGVLEAGRVEHAHLELWRRTVDIGDHVSLQGHLGHSRRGEPSVLVESWAMAAKALHPVPDARTGFTDPEARIRHRHLDLIVNPEVVARIHARSRAVAALRRGFAARGYVEVETPMLHAVHGGASARPFRTHINAYDADLYLRIAPELYLKTLTVGGFERIFELNRNFRNEGADATHNPEFTALEAYAVHGDYHTMRTLTEELVREAAEAIHGAPVAVRPGGAGADDRVRLDREWPVVPVHEAVSRAVGVELGSASPLAEVRAAADAHGVAYTATMTAGQVVLELYDELVESRTDFPTFYTDFPVETSPLTRAHRRDPALSERWDLVAFGAEIGTAYTELTDPVVQRERLVEQSFRAAAGDPEAMEVDERFLEALEYGMPPTGGVGIGVDRLVMMLTGGTIRGTLAFPFARPDGTRS